MLAEARLKILQDLIKSASKEELIWINGYLNALVANDNGHAENGTASVTANGSPSAASTSVKNISLVYGTETGNSKRIATTFVGEARKKGIHAKLTAMDQYRLTDLSKEEYLFIVVSTHGEGDPPDAAKKFYDHLHQNELSLAKLKYSVLALGDTAYPLFCKTGEDIDLRLKQAGGTTVVPIQKCDLDFETDAANWFNQVLNVLEKTGNTSASIVPQQNGTIAKKAGKKFYNGKIITNIDLNDKGSIKNTYHIEISTEETVEYEPGDALAVIPVNKKIIVDRIVSLSGIDSSKVIKTAKHEGTIEDLLTNHLNICFLLTSAIKKYAAIIQQDIPDTRMDLVDLLRIYPVKEPAQMEEFIRNLSSIAPRLYSISSSPAAHSGELHLTVSRNSFRVEDEQRFGLCSEFLGELPMDTEITFYIHKNRAFKLPPAEQDIIMIGPGTGIAPFRSFLAERDATGAQGKNWFFFGEQHFRTDFLYQTEMQQHAQTGVLSKISLAFSRDQQEKIYVQHRMLENANELYKWIESGSHIYISGTKDPMSADVEKTFLKIFEEHGNKTAEEAKSYLDVLKKEGRYQKDVY